jgi:two-component system cell cycle response regulator
VRIAVVDPSRTVLKAVSQLLEGDGHAVSVFVDGQGAIDFIKSNNDVSALITSAELDSMSGLELCWETRLLSGHDRTIYIILMSSNSEDKQLINALDSGADEFIRKPPAGEELYARLRSADRLLNLQRELIRLARIDPLTGVFNRRAFFEDGRRLCDPATSAARSAAIMFDVDHFKRVNDTYGHEVGDQVLRAIGRETPCEGTIVGRLGGEEFAILIKYSDLNGAWEHAEGLRTRLAELSFDTPLGPLSITSSFGVAEWQPGESVDELLKRADAALYQAKHSGRNRVETARSPDLAAGVTLWSGLVRSDIRGGSDQGGTLPPSSPQADPPVTWPSGAEDSMSSAPGNTVDPSTAHYAYVLDDEPQIGALVAKVLQACGLAARQFTSRAPFLEQLKASPPELVVLDLTLGESDAIEVIRDLEINKFQGRVLLISGRDEATLNEITQIGEKHGLIMLPPLKKPFRPADVRQRLQDNAADAAKPKVREARNESDASKKVFLQIVEALQNGWLELWYQPKIDLKSLAVRGAEALIRGRHPKLGIVAPANLLPPTGSVDHQPLTKFVVECAMQDWERFAQRGVLLKLSINAPVSIIQSPAFVTLIRSSLPKDSKFPGLIVEVTEDELIYDSEWAHEVASQLKLYSVDLSIDDFGSGYASLSRLNDLPFAEVKIDRSFVSGCAANALKHSLCQTVVDLAHRFGATACAEGVEQIEDLRALMAMRCDTAQGYLFAKPMPAASITSAALDDITRSIEALLDASGPAGKAAAQSA